MDDNIHDNVPDDYFSDDELPLEETKEVSDEWIWS
jgi:hypothetical protein